MVTRTCVPGVKGSGWSWKIYLKTKKGSISYPFLLAHAGSMVQGLPALIQVPVMWQLIWS